jgi:hypothetical protein
MGRLGAEAMATQPISLEDQLSWHLSSNHFPPVHEVFIPVAIAAIDAANEGDWDRVIEFPEGAEKDEAPTHEIVEGLHLDSWIDYSEEF